MSRGAGGERRPGFGVTIKFSQACEIFTTEEAEANTCCTLPTQNVEV